MIKDVGGNLLTGSLNKKYIVKVRPSSAKTSDMKYYVTPKKRDLIQESINGMLVQMI